VSEAEAENELARALREAQEVNDVPVAAPVPIAALPNFTNAELQEALNSFFANQQAAAAAAAAAVAPVVAPVARKPKKNTTRKSKGLKAEERRNGIYISGNTFPVKNTIKTMGGIWDRNTKQWKLPLGTNLSPLSIE
jgi:hypothetical protein